MSGPLAFLTKECQPCLNASNGSQCFPQTIPTPAFEFFPHPVPSDCDGLPRCCSQGCPATHLHHECQGWNVEFYPPQRTEQVKKPWAPLWK